MDSFQLPSELKEILEADRIIVQQKAISKEGPKYCNLNEYEVIINSPDNQWKSLLHLKEESSMKSRMFCCSARPFKMRGTQGGKTIMKLERPLRCPANFGCCCPYELGVEIPFGLPVGSIVQKTACTQNVFQLLDANGMPQLLIKGPWFAYHCCLDLSFKVYAMSGGRSIGRIIRQWREGTDMFHVAFPQDLHVLLKILLMNATVLIDFLYFGSR